MKINQAGIDLIKSFEGCQHKAYKDIVGILTIGYGHTGPEVVEGLTWTQDQCESRLVADLSRFEKGVSDCLTVPVTENQFAAMVSFAYNLGIGNLERSLLIRCVNKHNPSAAADQFLLWNHAGGRIVDGLTRRRTAERELFLKP